MKINSHPISGAALLALLVGLAPAISAQTQDQSANESIREQSQQSSERMQQQQQELQKQDLRKRSANELTGMDVKSRSGDSLGRVKDFVIDANSGQVVFAILGSGGVLGIGETLHAVPVAALNYEAVQGDERLTLDIDATRWAQAPRFKKDRISSLQADQEGRSTYEYYGQTWQAPAQAAATSQLVMSTDIIGKNIRSGTEEVGEIEDVLIQFQNRTAAVLLDPEDSFTGTDQKYIVPFNKLSVQNIDSLNTSLTRQDFSGAQVAQGDAWAQPGAGGIFIWSGMGAAERVAQDASQAAQRAGEKVAQAGERVGEEAAQAGERVAQESREMTPQGQPPVAEIRRVLQNDTTIAQQGGQNVQVIAEGDKVVLLGTVPSEEAKDQIEDRVEQAAPGWSVDNQIRVATADE